MSDAAAPSAGPSGGGRRLVIVLVIVAGVVALVGGGVVWFVLRDDAPAPVSLEAATQGIGGGTSPGAAGSGAPSADGVSGTWTVDTATGEFDFETATGTFAGFRVDEELTVGAKTAVGRTGDVSGQLVIDGTTVESVEVEVDLTTLTTNDSRRDGKVQAALDTAAFPTATFSSTEPVELPAEALTGAEVAVEATGTLTIHGESREVSMPLQAKLVGDTIVVVGSVPITFADYGVEPPTAPIVLSVSDTGTLELQLLFVRS